MVINIPQKSFSWLDKDFNYENSYDEIFTKIYEKAKVGSDNVSEFVKEASDEVKKITNNTIKIIKKTLIIGANVLLFSLLIYICWSLFNGYK